MGVPLLFARQTSLAVKTRIKIISLLLVAIAAALLAVHFRRNAPAPTDPLAPNSQYDAQTSSQPAPVAQTSAESIGRRFAKALAGQLSRDEYKLTDDEIAASPAKNKPNAASLVPAFEASRNRDFLK